MNGKEVDMAFHCHFYATQARGLVMKLNVMLASSLTSSTRELEKRLETKYGDEIKRSQITQKWNVTNFLVFMKEITVISPINIEGVEHFTLSFYHQLSKYNTV